MPLLHAGQLRLNVRRLVPGPGRRRVVLPGEVTPGLHLQRGKEVPPALDGFGVLFAQRLVVDGAGLAEQRLGLARVPTQQRPAEVVQADRVGGMVLAQPSRPDGQGAVQDRLRPVVRALQAAEPAQVVEAAGALRGVVAQQLLADFQRLAGEGLGLLALALVGQRRRPGVQLVGFPEAPALGGRPFGAIGADSGIDGLPVPLAQRLRPHRRRLAPDLRRRREVPPRLPTLRLPRQGVGHVVQVDQTVGMALAQRLAFDGGGLAKEFGGAAILAVGGVNPSQLAQRHRPVGVPAPQDGGADARRLQQQVLGGARIAHLATQPAQGEQAGGALGAAGVEQFPAGPQRLLGQGHGFGTLALGGQRRGAGVQPVGLRQALPLLPRQTRQVLGRSARRRTLMVVQCSSPRSLARTEAACRRALPAATKSSRTSSTSARNSRDAATSAWTSPSRLRPAVTACWARRGVRRAGREYAP